MKKRRIFILSMILCMLWGQALAVDYPVNYTVDEKFQAQAAQGALKGTIDFSVSGDATKAMPVEDFQLLKTTLPGTVITFTHNNRHTTGGWAVVETSDGAEKELKYVAEDGTLALGGNLAADDGTYYLLKTDAANLLTFFQKEESDLPGLADILQYIDAADEEWKTKAADRLSQYETALSMWMNDYTGTAMGQDGQLLYSELNCRIPAEAMKVQIQQMLHTFFADQETLALLTEVLAGTGAEIYLNPAMETAFCELVADLPLKGEIEVVRRFDSKGQLVLDAISLPLPPLGSLAHFGELLPEWLQSGLLPLSKWEKGSLTVTGKGDVSIRLGNEQAEQFLFAANAAGTNLYTGEMVMDVLNESGGMDHTGYAFEYTWQAMDETYSLQTDILERLMQGSVTLVPDEKTQAPRQRISLDLCYTTNSQRGSVAYLEAALVWKDMETEASVATTFHLQTADYRNILPSLPEGIAALENVLPVEEMTAEDRAALAVQVFFAPLNQAVTLPEM